jgi:hypothetical protein
MKTEILLTFFLYLSLTSIAQYYYYTTDTTQYNFLIETVGLKESGNDLDYSYNQNHYTTLNDFGAFTKLVDTEVYRTSGNTYSDIDYPWPNFTVWAMAKYKVFVTTLNYFPSYPFNVQIGYCGPDTSFFVNCGLECTSNISFSFAYGAQNVQIKEKVLETGDHKSYIYNKVGMAVHPLYLLSLVNGRYLKQGTDLPVRLSYKKIVGTQPSSSQLEISHPFLNGGNVFKSTYEINISISNGTSFKRIDLPEQNQNAVYTIPYNDLIKLFGGESNILGKELSINIDQYVGDNFGVCFSTIPKSFYYLPSLKVSLNGSNNPTCADSSNGSVNLRINNLPQNKPDSSIHYLYLVYRYDTSISENTNTVKPEDRSITWNGNTYYFQSSYTAKTIDTNQFSINNLPKGVYKIKVYCLAENTRYFPDSLIVELKEPSPISPNVEFENWGGYPVFPDRSYGFVKLNTTGGWTNSYFYSTNGGNTYKNYSRGSRIRLDTASWVTLKIKNSDECLAPDTLFKFLPPSPIKADFNPIPVDCNPSNSGKSNNGIIEFRLNGGLYPYSRVWIDNSPDSLCQVNTDTNYFYNLAPGKHTLYVLDSNRYSSRSFEFIIPQPDSIVIDNVSASIPECSYSKSTLTINTSGSRLDSLLYYPVGNPAQKIRYTDSVPSGKDLVVMAYTGKGCWAETRIKTPPAPPPITITDSVTKQASCAAASNGAAKIAIKGGTRNRTRYTITGLSGSLDWLNDSTFNYLNIPYGGYSFTAKDDNQCIAEASFKIDTITNRMAMLDPAVTPVSCETRRNGRIIASLNPSNNLAPPYTYEFRNLTRDTTYVISNGTSNSYTMTGLSNGKYQVKITDNDGCSSIKHADVSIHDSTLTWGPCTRKNASCPGISNGLLTASARNGFVSSGYIYTLSRPGMDTMVIATSGSTTFSRLAAAKNYTLKVTDDSACFISQSVIIDEDANPVVVNVTEKKDQYCNEVTNGSFRISATSSTGHFIDTLLLLHPGNIKELLDTSGSAFKNNLPAGNYTIKAIDDQGCKADMPLIISNLNNYPFARFISIDSVACTTATNGKLKVTATQKYYAGNYTFKLGATTLSSPDRVVEFTGLGARTSPANQYVLNITDSIGCSKDTSFCFYPVSKPVTIAGYGFTPASCVKAANAAINLQASGSKLPDPGYYFVLNGTDTLAGQTVTFSGQPVKGNNRVVLYDRYGCSVSLGPFWFPVRTDSLNIAVDQVVHASCPGEANGKVAVTALNGTPFADGFMYKVYGSPDQLLIMQQKGNRSHILGGLSKGDYSIEVADKDNCASMSRIVSIGEPEPVELSIMPGYVADKGASTGWANLVASKGNGRYNVEWYSGSTINAANLISATVTNSTSGISSRPAGTYMVRVQDTAQCSYWGTSWLSKTFVIPEPEKILSLDATIKNVRCFDESNGEIELKPSGGWGNNYKFGTSPSVITLSSPVFTGYKAGSYTFYVKDTAGVVKSAAYTIDQPQTLNAEIAATKDALCYGSADGEVELNVTGGNGSYSVSNDAVNWSAGTRKKALTAGTHLLYVRDILGCETRVTASIGQPDKLVLTDTTVTNTKCLMNEGKITVTAAGGIPRYDYAWYNGSNLIQQGEDHIENLYSGVYTLKITDAQGCELISDFYVSDLTDLAIDSVTTRPASCWQGNDGFASAKVLKGKPPYKIIWPGNIEGESVSNLSAGTYTVSVYDSEGCKVFNDFTITMPDSLWAQLIELQPPLCKGIADGIIKVAAMGGTPGYAYAWNTGRNTNILRNADAGIYRLLITDANNCQREYSFTLDYHESLKSDMPHNITLCRNASSPLSPGDYLFTRWSKDGQYFSSDPVVEVTEAGNYSVDFEDYRGCTGTDSIWVSQLDQIMEAQFLMASVISLTDTVIIFEASEPVPDSIKIILPKGLTVVDSGQYYRCVTASDTGVFSIGLVSYNGTCQDVITKQLTVQLPGDNLKSTSASGRLIRSFTLKPNPNQGIFNLSVSLNRKYDAILRIVSFGTGNTVALRKLSGSNTYDEIFNLGNLTPGAYLVNLQAGDEMQNIKMIVL